MREERVRFANDSSGIIEPPANNRLLFYGSVPDSSEEQRVDPADAKSRNKFRSCSISNPIVLFALALLSIAMIVTCALVIANQSKKNKGNQNVLSESDIETINQQNLGWQATYRSPKSLKMRHLLEMADVDSQIIANMPIKRPNVADLPTFFDARQKWPQCSSIGTILDQGHCSACYAYSAVESMMDRSCISSNGSFTPQLSLEDVVACCEQCGMGCNNGFSAMVWYFWIKFGIVSGSNDYYNPTGCMPIKIIPCDNLAFTSSETGTADGHRQSYEQSFCDSDGDQKTPKCNRECQPSFPGTYNQDKYFGQSVYQMPSGDEHAIMSEIYLNGPVQTSFTVYSDFGYYNSGVYKHSRTSVDTGRHFVKLIGWGVENATKYWLVANSWGPYWGENGLFRIVRGSNECGVENRVITGQPQPFSYDSALNGPSFKLTSQIKQSSQSSSRWQGVAASIHYQSSAILSSSSSEVEYNNFPENPEGDVVFEHHWKLHKHHSHKNDDE